MISHQGFFPSHKNVLILNVNAFKMCLFVGFMICLCTDIVKAAVKITMVQNSQQQYSNRKDTIGMVILD